MASDLISRVALLDFAHNHINGTIDCNDIARFPAVDAKPVRHASLKETGFDEAWCNWGDCTKCGTSNIFGSKYCNECGAKLDGGKQDAQETTL